jgi:aspartate/glutamate racemase
MLNKIWAGVTLLSAMGGWYLHGLVVDSRILAAERAAAIAMQYVMQQEFYAAKALEEKLQELKANERVIHTREREIVDRPVYRNICLDDDGLQVIEAYATNDATGISAD